MRPLINSADAYASLIEAIRLRRVTCVRLISSGKVRYDQAATRDSYPGGRYHELPVFDLTQIELAPKGDLAIDGQPTAALRGHIGDLMKFFAEQWGQGNFALPYDEAIYLQGNKIPAVWWCGVQADAVYLLPFRWVSREQVWLIETVISVPLLYGSGKLAPPIVDPDDPEESGGYDAFVRYRHIGDVKRYTKPVLRDHEGDFAFQATSLLFAIHKMMSAPKGEVVVVEGTHEAARINSRRDRLGLPKLQPVVRIVELTPRTRWTSGLPSEPTGRSVEPHLRRGTMVTNKYGTVFPRRSTVVNDPARTRLAQAPAIPVPWYEVATTQGRVDF